MTTELIPSISIEALLGKRDAAVLQVRIIAAANVVLETMEREHNIPCVTPFTHDHCAWTEEECTKRIDRDMWQQLLKESGLWSFMDAIARREWNKAWVDFDFPALTEDNIRTAFENLHGERQNMVARGVRELFDQLSDEHKTNTGRRFGERMILRHAVTGGYGNYYYPSTWTDDLLDDLNRVVHILRGELEPPHCAGRMARTALGGDQPWLAPFPYFTVKYHKAGTAHVMFTDKDDVDRLNKMLSISTGGNKVMP